MSKTSKVQDLKICNRKIKNYFLGQKSKVILSAVLKPFLWYCSLGAGFFIFLGLQYLNWSLGSLLFLFIELPEPREQSRYARRLPFFLLFSVPAADKWSFPSGYANWSPTTISLPPSRTSATLCFLPLCLQSSITLVQRHPSSGMKAAKGLN